VWALLRPLAGIAILGVLLWHLGTGPFLAGLRLIDGWALAAAVGIGALTLVCCAWRWSLIAGSLGMRLPVRTALADCYRAVFLNVTLPGGVLGDVHRGVHKGRDHGDVARGVRAVVWERIAGQLVQFAMAAVVLFVFPSPVRHYMPTVAAVLAASALIVLLLRRTAKPRERAEGRYARFVRTARTEVRDLLARRSWPGIVLASALVVAGNLATFLIAARTAGADAPLSRLVPLTMLALLAMSVPANVAGFGPREGVAAWAFAAAGLTAGQGLATAIVYGALVLAASLPGAVVLCMRRMSEPATAVTGGAARA
jgi:glycosyltransferase 2 family protein